jgi:hypothetical protein
MAKSKARIITPPNQLKQKVGSGGLDQKILEKGDSFIKSNEFDFEPYARQFLKQLDEQIDYISKNDVTDDEAIDRLSKPIMELKANGGMFGYGLITEIADIVLNFMENIKSLNDDTYEILDAHQRTLNIIVQNKLTGSGGSYGQNLADELYKACERYYNKYEISPQGIGSF